MLVFFGVFLCRGTMRREPNYESGELKTTRDRRSWGKYGAKPSVHRFAKELLGDWHGLYWQPAPESCILQALLYLVGRKLQALVFLYSRKRLCLSPFAPAMKPEFNGSASASKAWHASLPPRSRFDFPKKNGHWGSCWHELCDEMRWTPCFDC